MDDEGDGEVLGAVVGDPHEGAEDEEGEEAVDGDGGEVDGGEDGGGDEDCGPDGGVGGGVTFRVDVGGFGAEGFGEESEECGLEEAPVEDLFEEGGADGDEDDDGEGGGVGGVVGDGLEEVVGDEWGWVFAAEGGDGAEGEGEEDGDGEHDGDDEGGPAEGAEDGAGGWDEAYCAADGGGSEGEDGDEEEGAAVLELGDAGVVSEVGVGVEAEGGDACEEVWGEEEPPEDEEEDPALMLDGVEGGWAFVGLWWGWGELGIWLGSVGAVEAAGEDGCLRGGGEGWWGEGRDGGGDDGYPTGPTES